MTDTTPLALVTGASSGIGRELAKEFARNGFDLVITAEDAALEAVAAELGGGADPVQVQAVRTDLRTSAGVERLYAAVTATGRPLTAAALNAGVGQGGAFVDNDLADEFAIIDLNITSTVHLAKLVLRDMVARNDGKMLITSSIASTMPGAFQAVYNASKSFLQSFAEAVQSELRDTGVTVTSLMPGPTETEFFRRAELEDTKMGQASKDDPAQVAAQGFEAMMAGADKVVAGSLTTKAQEAVNKVLPDKVKAAGHRKMAEPGSGDTSR
jgi:short-subunit dehydrogenase